MKPRICLITVAMSLCLAADQSGSSASAKTSPAGNASKTPWGDPDLQGTWTSDDVLGVPFERPKKFGTRATLTEDELKERQKSVVDNEEFVDTGGANHSPAKAQIDAAAKGEAPPPPAQSRAGRGVDSQPVPLHWGEFARRASHQSSQIVDPPNGRLPPLTPEAQAKLDAKMKLRREPIPASWLNWSAYDRCISRGVAGSILPVVYGNGLEIVQSPGYVAIRYEMVHAMSASFLPKRRSSAIRRRTAGACRTILRTTSCCISTSRSRSREPGRGPAFHWDRTPWNIAVIMPGPSSVSQPQKGNRCI